jgi:hypothetical protein
LGIEVKRSSEGLLLTQEGYAKDVTKRVGMGVCKTMNTHMAVSKKLSILDGEKLGPVDSTQYRSIVGAL